MACKQLMSRIKSVKADMENPDPSWIEAVKVAHKKGVDLTYRH